MWIRSVDFGVAPVSNDQVNSTKRVDHFHIDVRHLSLFDRGLSLTSGPPLNQTITSYQCFTWYNSKLGVFHYFFTTIIPTLSQLISVQRVKDLSIWVAHSFWENPLLWVKCFFERLWDVSSYSWNLPCMQYWKLTHPFQSFKSFSIAVSLNVPQPECSFINTTVRT